MGLSWKEFNRMSWAEFDIRLFAFNRQRQTTVMLVRELAYEIHTTKYVFGNKKPPSKNEYWDLHGKHANKMDKIAEALARASKKENG